jgi:hypothetical protein
MKKSKKQGISNDSSNGNNGVTFFAYNNEQIDYIRLAVLAASAVKKHMKNNQTCLITNKSSLDWSTKSITNKVLNKAFDHIISEEPDHKPNIRKFYDSPWATFECQFENWNKNDVIKLTPFDKTLMLDVDFLVNNNFLDVPFGIEEPLMLYTDAITLRNERPFHLLERKLHKNGIPMLWSTAIYFDKNDEVVQLFFELWGHIKDNWDFYRYLYGFSTKIYRTDFAVSIATHVLNGFIENTLVKSLPDNPMKYVEPKDDIERVLLDGVRFLSHKPDEEWLHIFAVCKNENLHIMNKKAIDRNWDKLMELYE